MFLEGGREPEEPEGEPLWGDSADTYIQGRAAVNQENTEKVLSLEKRKKKKKKAASSATHTSAMSFMELRLSSAEANLAERVIKAGH